MKVCFPVEAYEGSDSMVYGHFGSASGFVLYNTDSKEYEFIDNKDVAHEHGACNPTEALSGRKVDAVVVGGIGQGAIMKLAADGISVLRAKSGLVSEDVEHFMNGELEVLTLDMQTCSHGAHDCGGH